MIFIGVDGGGTKTAVAAYKTIDCDGKSFDGIEIAGAVSGPMNYNFIGVEKAAENLLEAVRALDIPMTQVCAIAVGDPSIDEGMPEGESTGRFAERIGQELGVPVYIRSDAYMTLFGMREQTSVLTISGTGAMSIAETRDGVLTAGGWGRLTGDEGSGYFIAQESIKAALHDADGIGPETTLTEAVLRYFGASEPRELISIFYGENCPDIAGFAKEAALCAENGDATARDILLKAAGYLASYTERLIGLSGSETVGVYGSVICKNRIVRQEFERLLLEKHPSIKITEPSIPATEAAARYAKLRFGS